MSPDRRHAIVDAFLLPKCLFEMAPTGLKSVRSHDAIREVLAAESWPTFPDTKANGFRSRRRCRARALLSIGRTPRAHSQTHARVVRT